MKVREERIALCAQILKDMREADLEMSFPDKHSLAKAMKRFFTKHLRREVESSGSRWRLSLKYVKNNIKAIQRELRQEDLYFICVRSSLTVTWRFGGQSEYQESLRWDGTGIATRTEDYNERLEDGQKRWRGKIGLPPFEEPPLLPRRAS